MSKAPVVFCRDCKFSAPDQSTPWSLRCHNPEVNRHDSWALAASCQGRGTDCTTERRVSGWSQICGIKGKQYQLSEVVE